MGKFMSKFCDAPIAKPIFMYQHCSILERELKLKDFRLNYLQ
jgi:hypothetical protein